MASYIWYYQQHTHFRWSTGFIYPSAFLFTIFSNDQSLFKKKTHTSYVESSWLFFLRNYKSLWTTLNFFPFFLDSRSCTGTIEVKIVDENDNPPEILQNYLVICKPKMEHVDISAVDPDEPMHGAPFHFSLAKASPEINRLWTLAKVNGISSKIMIYMLWNKWEWIYCFTHVKHNVKWILMNIF